MSIVAVILASSLAVLSYKIEKRLYNPVTLFCGIWALVILFAALHLYGMKEVSDYAYSIMTLGIVCFSLGSYMALSIRKRFKIGWTRKRQPVNASENYSINYPVVYLVGSIVLIYLVVESVVAFFAYRSGVQMNGLRSSMMGYSTTGYASGMALLRQGPLALIYSFVFLPGFYSLLLVTSVDVIIGQKNRLLIVMSIVAVVLKNYAEGCSLQARSTQTMRRPCAVGRHGRKDNKNREQASRTILTTRRKVYDGNDPDGDGQAYDDLGRTAGLCCRRWAAVLRQLQYPQGSVLSERQKAVWA